MSSSFTAIVYYTRFIDCRIFCSNLTEKKKIQWNLQLIRYICFFDFAFKAHYSSDLRIFY